MSRHAYRCPFCWVWYGCRPRAEAYPPTEDRACDACSVVFEAGRLAAIRDDVACAAGQLERRAAEALDRARGLQNVLDSADFLFGVDRSEMQAESDEARIKAELLTAKATDCRRWLEATS